MSSYEYDRRATDSFRNFTPQFYQVFGSDLVILPLMSQDVNFGILSIYRGLRGAVNLTLTLSLERRGNQSEASAFALFTQPV